ncbi:GNAT family N-acetyltransferase [Alteribacillus iranensis]|uniref:Acetyltransferase (GNAT) domain-containing protein n=1 Tax=Alteribacillus iranensis TaxID=930128 RepID=A0A1I2CZC2_9BACI|nr:GNAT family N-acetyltransferase [Alteribacillus iranensis]SFE73575.1 Acetyltransferase (GNAT) domain-containing protein [Alteribacillus iranensis]
MKEAHWYEKLSQYFPIEEMKSQEHMELLLKEKSDIYHKDEGAHHVVMYVETDDFIFIDYLLVAKEARGQGLGKKIIEEMKKKNKPIILEVEPLDYEDSDTEKRFRFYQRAGFKHASSIGYTRKSLATDEDNTLEILYWSPEDESEESIFDKMKHTYNHIHTYKDEELYGKAYQKAEDVLTFDENSE